MALQYSTIVSIIYFSVNVVFMFGLAFYVYKTGNHKIKSKSYIKDVWNQKKIFFPLIIHFYDTATDIGVIYNWAELMKDEESINYESIDMKTFFWSGIAFLIIYRVGTLFWALYKWRSGDGEWYYIILVLFDLYIFVIVYESFNKAQGIITKNAQRRHENRPRKQQKTQQEIDEKLYEAIEMGQITTDKAAEIKSVMSEDVEIEPADTQMRVQIFEAVTESMPQIVIQSVFIIRSANDETLLKGGSNIGLLLFSVLASLLSISNKYSWIDKRDNSVCDRALSLKPRKSFPDCIHYWYIIRVFWRVSHTFAKFAVFTLIWTVLGGAFLPIWIVLLFIFWVIASWKIHDSALGNGNIIWSLIYDLVFLIAIVDCSKKERLLFLFKWIETTVGITVITIFILLRFDCGICADSQTRMIINNESKNERVLIYFILGVFAHLMDLVLYISMYFGNILMDREDVIYHNRWGHTFGGMKREPFKKLINDYKTERITGIRLSKVKCQAIKTIEFQVNGIWRGQIGKESEDMSELMLSEDEYINQVRINKYLWYVQFSTNKGNVIAAGDKHDRGHLQFILKGNYSYKVADCKGEYIQGSEVSTLQFMWHKIND